MRLGFTFWIGSPYWSWLPFINSTEETTGKFVKQYRHSWYVTWFCFQLTITLAKEG